MEYASRLQRFIAFVIDFIILAVILGILTAIGIIEFALTEEGEFSRIDNLIQALIVVAYFVILTVAFGATLGKMALGMRVVDGNGNKAGAGPVLIREVIARAVGALLTVVVGASIGQLVGIAVVVIIVIMILFDEKRQGLHDKIGGTFVVKAK
ncbi:MAG: RDD family protein [Chloroflexota bacterium]|nr:RDD family protein [Chloroflexota bacterium]MDE2886228.1 RDD family protein [Chloroflexota bacterium]